MPEQVVAMEACQLEDWDELIKAVACGRPCNAKAFGAQLSAQQIAQLVDAAPSRGNCKVLKDADFTGVTFLGPVEFSFIRFVGDVSFKGATFKDAVAFLHIEDAACTFNSVTFESELLIGDWKSRRQLYLEQCRFKSLVHLYDVDVDYLSFASSIFSSGMVFSDVKVASVLSFCAVTFKERVREFVAGCQALDFQRCRLERGGVFYLHGGSVGLGAVELGAPTMIAGTQTSGQFHNVDRSLVVGNGAWRPRISGVEGTDVDKLVLQNVNLAECLFEGAFNLDKLRLEGLCTFDEPPKGLHFGIAVPFLWAWTKRMTIGEERAWRSRSRKGLGWRPRREEIKSGQRLLVLPRDFVEKLPFDRRERQAQAEQVAKIYRALRKGREDAKNQPGASDFYYGEMEMRRAGSARLGEKVVLWLYWLLSGYGLRPMRTVLALALLLTVSSYVLMRVGIAEATTGIPVSLPYWKAFLISFAAAVNLEYLKPEAFTLAGQWIRIVLKILGPTLFGVLLLAFWGRVKR